MDSRYVDSRALDDNGVDSRYFDSRALNGNGEDSRYFDSRALDDNGVDSRYFDSRALNGNGEDSRYVDSRSMDDRSNDRDDNMVLNRDHGGIPMGPSHGCDNGKIGIEVDWDPKSTAEYTCDPGVVLKKDAKYEPKMVCERRPKSPLHICIKDRITYGDYLPISGSHRPVWPTFGTYRYLPPQRWLHGLEHAAILLVYHPCVDKKDLQPLIDLLRSCVRRHLITPYKKLSTSKPFALVNWGCKLEMSIPDVEKAKEFIMDRANKGLEPDVYYHGGYNTGLTKMAKVVSDVKDSTVCPSNKE
ncbi:hypothetical protein SNE40_004140 [Patella caerulea]